METDIAVLERLIAERERVLAQLDLVDRIIERDEISGLKAELDAVQNPTVDPSITADEELEGPELPKLPTSRRGGMPFVVSFLPQWRPGSASVCTYCRKPFTEQEIYLRGELYTMEAKRWTWISLHEECVLQHATVRQYFTGVRSEDFRAWFREQERSQPCPGT